MVAVVFRSSQGIEGVCPQSPVPSPSSLVLCLWLSSCPVLFPSDRLLLRVLRSLGIFCVPKQWDLASHFPELHVSGAPGPDPSFKGSSLRQVGAMGYGLWTMVCPSCQQGARQLNVEGLGLGLRTSIHPVCCGESDESYLGHEYGSGDFPIDHLSRSAKYDKVLFPLALVPSTCTAAILIIDNR